MSVTAVKSEKSWIEPKDITWGVNRVGTAMDTTFNVLDAIPIVAQYTAPVRILAGCVQASVLPLFALIAYGIAYLSGHADDWAEEMKILAYSQMVHGAFNICRGMIEVLLAITVWGSAAMFAYELCRDKPFSPTVEYKDCKTLQEAKEHLSDPLHFWSKNKDSKADPSKTDNKTSQKNLTENNTTSPLEGTSSLKDEGDSSPVSTMPSECFPGVLHVAAGTMFV